MQKRSKCAITENPQICDRDKNENLREAGRIIQSMLEFDHPEFLRELYLEQRLDWFCRMVEVRAVYLIDEILLKNSNTEVIIARDMAFEELLQDPEDLICPPYVQQSAEKLIVFPSWIMNFYGEKEMMITDVFPLVDGISEVLSVIDDCSVW